MGNGHTSLEHEQDQQPPSTSVELQQDDHNPLLDGSAEERLKQVRELMFFLEAEEDPWQQTQERGAAVLDEALTPHHQRVQGSTRFGRSLDLTQKHFIDPQPERYSGIGGFFKRGWLKTKSLFGFGIEEKKLDFAFNDNLTIKEADVSQQKVDGSRKLIVQATDKPVELKFPQVKLLSGLSLLVNGCTFNYRYDITTKRVEQLDLELGGFNLQYGIFNFTLERPRADFIGNNLDLNVTVPRGSLALKFPNFPVSGLWGDVQNLTLMPRGVAWEKASAGMDSLTLLDVLELEDLTFSFLDKTPESSPLQEITLGGLRFQYQGEKVSQRLELSQARYSEKEKAFYLANLDLSFVPGRLGMNLHLDNLFVSLRDEALAADEAGLSLALAFGEERSFTVTGTLNKVSWSRAGGFDFTRAAVTLEDDLEIEQFGVAVQQGTTLELEKNKHNLKTITVKTGISQKLGDTLSGEFKGTFQATEVAPEKWNYRVGATELGGTAEPDPARLQGALQTGELELDVTLTGVELESVLDEQTLTQRQSTFDFKGAETRLEMLGITAAGSFEGLAYDQQRKDISFQKLSFSLGNAQIGSYFFIREGSLTIEREDTQKEGTGPPQAETEETAPAPAPPAPPAARKYSYRLGVTDAVLDLEFVRFNLNMEGQATPLAPLKFEDEANPDLSAGWLFNFDQIGINYRQVKDGSFMGLSDLSLNIQKLAIDTRKASGSLKSGGFGATLWGKVLDGSVTDLTWDSSSYRLGSWEAGIADEVDLKPLPIKVTGARFSMEQQGDRVSKRLGGKNIGFDFQLGDLHFKGGVSGVNYELDRKAFFAEQANVNFTLGNRSLGATLYGVKSNPETGSDLQGMKITYQGEPLEFLDGSLKFYSAEFDYKKNEGNKGTLTVGGSASVHLSKILSLSAENAEIKKQLDTESFQGKIGTMDAEFFETISCEAQQIKFSEHSFESVFATPPALTAGHSGLGSLLGPSVKLLNLGGMFGDTLKFKPRKLVYREGKFSFTDEDVQVDTVPLEDEYISGSLDLNKPANSSITFAAKYPDAYDGGDPRITGKTFSFTFPVYSVGIASVYVGLTAGFGYSFNSGKLKPELSELQERRLKFQGGVTKKGAAFADLTAGVQLGCMLLGVKGEGFAGLELALGGPESTATLVMEEAGGGKNNYKLVGEKSNLLINLAECVKTKLGVRIKASLLGKEKQVKEWVFKEATFGHIVGQYLYNFEKGGADKKVITKQELHFEPHKDLDTSIGAFEPNNERYEEIMREADRLLLYEHDPEGNTLPREELIHEAREKAEDVERELFTRRKDLYIIQRDLGEYKATANNRLIESRDQVKKHEYRISNEQFFQEALEDWKPKLEIMPSYEQYDLGKLASFKEYAHNIVKIGNSIRALKEDYNESNYIRMLQDIQEISRIIKSFQDNKPNKVVKGPGNKKNVVEFYKKLLPDHKGSVKKIIKEMAEFSTASDKTGDSSSTEQLQSERERLQNQLLSALQEDKSAAGMVQRVALQKILQTKNILAVIDNENLNTIYNMLYGGQGPMLYGGTLKQLYSDNAVTLANKEIKDIITGIEDRRKKISKVYGEIEDEKREKKIEELLKSGKIKMENVKSRVNEGKRYVEATRRTLDTRKDELESLEARVKKETKALMAQHNIKLGKFEVSHYKRLKKEKALYGQLVETIGAEQIALYEQLRDENVDKLMKKEFPLQYQDYEKIKKNRADEILVRYIKEDRPGDYLKAFYEYDAAAEKDVNEVLAKHEKLFGVDAKKLDIYQLAKKANLHQMLVDEFGEEKVKIHSLAKQENVQSGVAEEMLTYKYVARHTSRRKQFYNEKIGQTEIKLTHYDQKVQEMKTEINTLADVKQKLETLAAARENLAKGDPGSITTIIDAEKKGHKLQQAVAQREAIDADKTVQEKKNEVEQAITDLNNVVTQEIEEEKLAQQEDESENPAGND